MPASQRCQAHRRCLRPSRRSGRSTTTGDIHKIVVRQYGAAVSRQDRPLPFSLRCFRRSRRMTVVAYESVMNAPMFVPAGPGRLLVLVPGHPWPDGSRTDEQLRQHAAAAVWRWRRFALRYAIILVAPVFGARYQDFREGGSAADYVTTLAQQVAGRYLPASDRRFALHGHSAGAQFAVRYLVTHADHLTDALISAPSEYAFPASQVAWPHGAAGAPQSADWVAAVSGVRITVLVGSRDLELRPPAPGHVGVTRADRASEWVTAMRQCAADNQRPATIDLQWAQDLDHDETSMGRRAQEVLAAHWG